MGKGIIKSAEYLKKEGILRLTIDKPFAVPSERKATGQESPDGDTIYEKFPDAAAVKDEYVGREVTVSLSHKDEKKEEPK